MDKQYYPVEIEEKWSKIWSEKVLSNKDSDASFSQVIPPPNVTGTLHMGHSFQYAIMDFYTRYHHMSGKDAHWQVGADHAGIATQMVVENNLAKKDVTRKELGREKFLEEVWSWKDYSEEKIISQIKTFLISLGTNEQILFEMISGSIGITVLGKYIDVPLLKASVSNSVLGKTTDATSAIATLRV